MSYLSNGTEGEMWMGRWCFVCTNDHQYHFDDDPAGEPCSVQTDLYLGDPNEALSGSGLELRCSAFSPCSCGETEVVQ